MVQLVLQAVLDCLVPYRSVAADVVTHKAALDGAGDLIHIAVRRSLRELLNGSHLTSVVACPEVRGIAVVTASGE